MAMTKSHVAGVTLGSNREDLSDILTILEPERTPLLSLAKKEKPAAHSSSGKLMTSLRQPLLEYWRARMRHPLPIK